MFSHKDGLSGLAVYYTCFSFLVNSQNNEYGNDIPAPILHGDAANGVMWGANPPVEMQWGAGGWVGAACCKWNIITIFIIKVLNMVWKQNQNYSTRPLEGHSSFQTQP